jgi:polyhydroxyalkanoate synthesis repressor PhaR
MRVVKKYANRKLYDTVDKKYVTMDALAELIKNGEEITVIDNKSGKDITTSVISQLLAREKKEGGKDYASGLLTDLLRKGGGTIKDYARKYSALWHGAINMAEEEIDKIVDYLVKGKEITEAEGDKLKEEIINRSEILNSWVRQNIDKKIDEALKKMNLTTREQVKRLSRSIDELSEKVKRLEQLHITNESKVRTDPPNAESGKSTSTEALSDYNPGDEKYKQ